jgi:cytoskeleton protein RodZ
MFPTGGYRFSTEWFTIRMEHAAMFAIGDSLREARTRRGFSSADVQKGIRIRERYLTALEEERWELLPGEAYTKGFLRTYAEFLGLDGNLYIDEYNARVAIHDEEPLVPHTLAPAHKARRSIVRTLMGIMVLALAIAGLAAWGMGGSTPNAAKSGAAALQVQDASAAVATPAKTRAIPHAQALPAWPTTAAATQLAKKTVISATRGRCWLSIRTGGPNGQILFQGVLEQGKTLHYTLGHRIWVRMGRPGNIDISLGANRVNGLPAQPGNVLLTSAGPQAA